MAGLTELQRRLYRHPAFVAATARAAAAYSWALQRRAHDVTDAVVGRRCVVLAPHPDDETLGCGGTVWRKRRAGTDVTVVVATDGRFSHTSAVLTADELAVVRERESRRAAATLGVDPAKVCFLGHWERSLRANLEALTAQVGQLLVDHDPEELLVPSDVDRLEDHRALHEAGLRAAAAHRHPLTVLEYPIWLWDAQAWIDPAASAGRKVAQLLSRPLRAVRHLEAVTVDVSAALSAKRQAIDCYESQMTNLTGEAGWPTMDPRFIARFLEPTELFFVATPGSGRRWRS